MTARRRQLAAYRRPPDPALVDLVRAMAIDAARRDHTAEIRAPEKLQVRLTTAAQITGNLRQ